MRQYQDLREFLTALEQEGQLLRITEEVKFEPDLAAAACALVKVGENVPAILFNNIAGCADVQIAMNVHGSWPNHALALGMDKSAPLRDQFSNSFAGSSCIRVSWNASQPRRGRS